MLFYKFNFIFNTLTLFSKKYIYIPELLYLDVFWMFWIKTKLKLTFEGSVKVHFSSNRNSQYIKKYSNKYLKGKLVLRVKFYIWRVRWKKRLTHQMWKYAFNENSLLKLLWSYFLLFYVTYYYYYSYYII